MNLVTKTSAVDALPPFFRVHALRGPHARRLISHILSAISASAFPRLCYMHEVCLSVVFVLFFVFM